MGDFFSQLTEQAQRTWAALGLAQRVTLAAFVIGSVALFLLVSLWSGGADYRLLAGGLTAEDAAEAAAKLNDDRIPYRYEAGRGALLVPAGRLEEARRTLLAAGLPKGGGTVGFELFDKGNFAVPEFVQRINKLRAITGELERKIAELDGVNKASVTISIPDDDPFARNQRDATATVALTMARGRRPRAGLIAAVRHLVASAEGKLDVRNVAVTDSAGNMYAGFQGGAGPLGLTGEQLAYRMQVENRYEDKAQTMLDEVLGPGNAVVRVTAELNFDAAVSEEVTRTDPLTKEKTTKVDKSRGFDATPRGPTGAADTPVGGKTQGVSERLPTSEKNTKETREVFDTEATELKRVKRVEQAVGALKRLSVAVTIAQGEKPRSKTELDELKKLVSQAVGLSEKRGDLLALFETPFPKPEVEKAKAGFAAANLEEYWGRYGSTALSVAALVVMLFVFLRLMKRLAAPPPALEVAVREANAPGASNAAPEQQALEQVQKREEASKLVMEHADQATQIIRSMLK